MKNIRNSIQRHLTDPPYYLKINVITNQEFLQANLIFNAQLVKLREEGKDTATHKPVVQKSDMDKLSKSIKIDNPVGLQERVFIDFMVHFGRRGREGLRNLRKDCFEFAHDGELERDYVKIRINEITKTDDGTKNHTKVPKDQVKKMWSATKGRCPVKTLKLYVSKLNPSCDALFQRANTKFSATSDRWFDNMPLGVKSLGNMMSKLSEKYGLAGQYTNHSLRATTVTALNHAGVGAGDICHVTGHKSIESLRHYCDRPSLGKSCDMSDVLHRYMDHEAGEGTSSGRDPMTENVPPQNVPSAGGDNNQHIGSTVNISNLGQLGNGLPSGIFSGAIFHGQVNINFNIGN